MKKKLMSVLFVLCLVFSLMPETVLATEGSGINKSEVGDFVVEGGETEDYDYQNDTLTFKKAGTYTISMKEPDSTTTDKIVVANGITANITLKGVNIDIESQREISAFEIKDNSTVNLTLKGTNTLASGPIGASLEVGIGDTLTITKSSVGSLRIVSYGNGAGIGGRCFGEGGTININGGTVTALSPNGAGIGGGQYGSGGTININGGTVTASSVFGAGIGGGEGGSGETININGGTVTAISSEGAGIGGGTFGDGGTININGGTITATSSGGAGIGGGDSSGRGTVYINGGTITATSSGGAGIGIGRLGNETGSFSTSINGNAFIIASSISDKTNQSNWSGVIFEGDEGKVYRNPILKTNAKLPAGKTLTIDNDKTLTIDNDVTLTNEGAIIANGIFKNNGIIRNQGTIEGTVGGNAPLQVIGDYIIEGITPQDYTYQDKTLTFEKAGTYTISMKEPGSMTTDKIVVANGITANITLNGVNIDVESQGDISAFEIKDNSTVNLTLKGTNTLVSGLNRAGLEIGIGDALTITKSSIGSLAAKSRGYGAGIGGRDSGEGGTININGGTVTALSSNGAGIGGGQYGSGGTININGGTVRATSDFGAGIGGGQYGSGGTININGGTVRATNVYGAGIGGGKGGSGGIININGGTIISTSSNGAGIGGGVFGDGGTINVNGGTITATSSLGAGIGIGFNGNETGSFSTSINGNVFIIASSISDKTNQSNWSGVIFEGDEGKVYRNPILKTNAELPAGKMLTIDNDKTLTIDTTITLTNHGSVINDGTIINKGTLDNRGTITNNGIIKNYGTIEGTIIGTGKLLQNSQTMVSFAVKQANGTFSESSTAKYGDTIKIIAAMSASQVKGRSAIANTVDFYLGGVNDKKLNDNPILVLNSNGVLTASYEITLSGEHWKPNDTAYLITADFGGYEPSNLLESIGSSKLIVGKMDGATAPSTGFSFDGDNKTKLMNTTDGMEYSLDGGINWNDCTETNTDLNAKLYEITADKDIKIRMKETDTQLIGEIQTINIEEGMEVTGVTAVACTNANGNDGSLQGVTEMMEYKSIDSNEWMSGDGNNINGLLSGSIYVVRMKATGTMLAGKESKHTIESCTPIHGISLSKTGTHTFMEAIVGYGAQNPYTVMMSNTGNQDTGVLNVVLSGSNSDSFTVSKDFIDGIAIDGKDSFTIVPNTGLEVGTYTATVTISGSNNISVSFNVSFTVKDSNPTKPDTAEEKKPSNKVETSATDKRIMFSGLALVSFLSACWLFIRKKKI